MVSNANPAGVWSHRRPPLVLITFLLCAAALTACGKRETATPTPTPLDPRLATSVPAASPTADQVATLRPTEVGGPCSNISEFVADVTLPDNTRVRPGAQLDKSWRVRNAGTCDWGPGYELVYISGAQMGAPVAVALFPARAGVEVEIRMTFTAPTTPGSYTTTWQMRDPNAQLFGDVLFMTVIVDESAP